MMIEDHPLQVYSPAIFFAPRGTITRNQFESNEFNWLNTNEVVEEDWGQCLQTLEGHENSVYSVAFSSSNKLLASGDQHGSIKLWDPRGGLCLRTLESRGGSVNSLAFSPDDTWFAAASNAALEIWQTNSGKCLKIFGAQDIIESSVAISPDGTRLAFLQSSILILETEKWEHLKTLEGRYGRFQSVTFSSDGTLLASGDTGNIQIWDTNTWQCLQSLDFGGYSLAFSPNGKIFASCTSIDQGKIRIWDAVSWQELKDIDHGFSARFLAFSNDGTKLLCSSPYGNIIVGDTHSYECIQVFKRNQSPFSAISISKDDAYVASGSYDNTVQIWDLHSKMCLQSIDRHDAAINSHACDFSPDGAYFVSGSEDRTIKIWDAYSGECLETIKDQCDRIAFLSFSPNVALLVSGDTHGKILVWKARSWQCLKTLEGGGSYASSVAFSPDGALLVSSYESSLIIVWNTSSWESLKILDGEERELKGLRGIDSMVFSHDGTRFACLSSENVMFASLASRDCKGVVKIWDTRNWDCLHTIICQDERITSLFFTHDGSLLASGVSTSVGSSMDAIKIWDVQKWICLHTLENYGSLTIKLHMDITQSYVQTNRGILTLPSPPTVGSSQTEPSSLSARGFGVSDDATWILWNSSKLLKLPSVYKLNALAISRSGNGIGIDFESGHVILLNAGEKDLKGAVDKNT